MDKVTREALKKSIAHWRRMRRAKTIEELNGESPEDIYCALCIRFVCNPENGDCSGCPVYEKTGKSQCFDTPYYDARSYFDIWENSNTKEDRKKWRKAADKEIKFLVSLLKQPGEA